MSSTTSEDDSRDAKTLLERLQNLQNDPITEDIAMELEALMSIYSEPGAIRAWKPENLRQNTESRLIRYEVQTSSAGPALRNAKRLLSPHSGITFRILVSLPPTYPDSSPPQLQLLSRYIGAFQIDATLFSGVLKTYISSSGVERHEGEVAVFDGIERTREVIQRWYEERLSESILREVMREDGKAQHVHQVEAVPTTSQTKGTDSPTGGGIPAGPELSLVPLPDGIEIYEAGAITDRKSSFVGRACRITHPSQVLVVLSHLMSDRRIARAAHPVINAWRCELGGVLHQDNDDDGESAAGGRLAHLLQIMEVKDVLVVVTRYFGGIHLGPDRFKHINQAARAALEEGGFLESNDTGRGAKTKGKRKVQA